LAGFNTIFERLIVAFFLGHPVRLHGSICRYVFKEMSQFNEFWCHWWTIKGGRLLKKRVIWQFWIVTIKLSLRRKYTIEMCAKCNQIYITYGRNWIIYKLCLTSS